MHSILNIFLIIFALSGICIADNQEEQVKRGKTILVTARDYIYNFDKNDELIESCLSRSRDIFSSLSDKRESLYWTAQVEYLTGLSYMGKKEHQKASIHFEYCIDLINKAIEKYGEFSKGYTLEADAYVQLMWCKGMTYQLLHFQTLKTLPEKAIKLDPNNLKAYNSLAVFCINAPQPLGGNPEKAIDLLWKASKNPINDKGDMFSVYYLLGFAYTKLHDTTNAIRYLQLALSIYPQNQWAKEDLEKVESQLR